MRMVCRDFPIFVPDRTIVKDAVAKIGPGLKIEQNRLNK